MKFYNLLFCFLIFASSLHYCEAQKTTPRKKSETAASGLAQDSSKQFYSDMQWRSIGPYQGGRSLTVSGVIGNPMIYYEGATGGGVWKTTDGGNTWVPISDSSFHSASV